MLVDLGANLEATDDDGQKPIHMAAQSNQPQVVRLLLDQKPNSIFLVTKVWSLYMAYYPYKLSKNISQPCSNTCIF